MGGPPCVGGGVFNVSICQFGSPTLLSWPHFYNGDSAYRDAVKGLNPRQEDHEFYLEVIPRTGLPLRANARMQINMQLVNVSEIKPAAGLRPMVFPVLWFQDGVPQMPDATISQLRMSANLPETLKITTLSLSFVFGCALLVLGITLLITLCFCDQSEDDQEKKVRAVGLRGHVNPGMEHSGEKD